MRAGPVVGAKSSLLRFRQQNGENSARSLAPPPRRHKLHILRFRLWRKLIHSAAAPFPTKALLLRGPSVPPCWVCAGTPDCRGACPREKRNFNFFAPAGATLRGFFDAQRTGGADGPARALSVRFIPRPGCGPAPPGRPPGSPPSRPASRSGRGCPHPCPPS